MTLFRSSLHKNSTLPLPFQLRSYKFFTFNSHSQRQDKAVATIAPVKAPLYPRHHPIHSQTKNHHFLKAVTLYRCILNQPHPSSSKEGKYNFSTLSQTCSQDNPQAPFAFKDSMIHVLHFTLLIALCCVLHRCTSLEIHR